MANLLSKVSGAMAACARRVSRATRRLLRSRSIRKGKKEVKTSGADGEAVWHRSILLGQRCEPLNFSGAIHYDAQGRRLSQPRGGTASAKQQLQAATMLICLSADVVDEAITDGERN
ncbi:uncharacterized protein LOC112271110 [Brachypodium distachyon]|uniref:Uncharacterized protein n=1 Tax=Brachypodium distachyon TaxID=15368 RepID=A0A0Q3GDU8_BRADI|nr:uncharacterized protein LOC112271110 [Brachypodium distachyon]KQK08645.1 hypothetical protein BRADI_2g43010v3 [Brachypodium distachyon]|eukprot:XP_024315876.1 uncharacterized protein LOC112271110 [Brachypodium distachyon]